MLSDHRFIVVGASTLVLILILAPAVAAAAQARIVLNRSIAGIGLGMRAAEVRAKLGPPSLATTANGSRDLVYRDRALVVTVVRSRVAIVSSQNRHERTSSGVGVGSTSSRLRRRVDGLRCGDKAGVAYCRLGSIRPGRRSTTFQIFGGRVVTVTVARGFG